jgi:TM2 domain-containing membrane protein YozV
MGYQEDLNNAKSLFDSGALSSEEYNKLKESILKNQQAYQAPGEPEPQAQQAYQAPNPEQQQSHQQNYNQQQSGPQGGPQYYQQQNNQQQGGPQYYQQGTLQYYPPNAKSRIAAGLFGIFLGHLGVHNFYLGYTGKAVAQLVLTIIGWCTVIILIGFVFIAISAIWGLVEGIMILAGGITIDGKGVPLRD